MTAGLRKKDPFFLGKCRFGDQNCIVEEGRDCSTMHVIYEITCNTCQQIIDTQIKDTREPGNQKGKNYIGMTMTLAHCRMVTHLSDQKSKRNKCPLWRHDRDSHEGERQQYKTRILSKDRSVLPLSILEALYIEKQIPGTSLNERNEFGRGSIVRLSAERAVS